MNNYRSMLETATSTTSSQGETWKAINPEFVARMQLQNRFRTGLDIAKYTAKNHAS